MCVCTCVCVLCVPCNSRPLNALCKAAWYMLQCRPSRNTVVPLLSLFRLTLRLSIDPCRTYGVRFGAHKTAPSCGPTVVRACRRHIWPNVFRKSTPTRSRTHAACRRRTALCGKTLIVGAHQISARVRTTAVQFIYSWNSEQRRTPHSVSAGAHL